MMEAFSSSCMCDKYDSFFGKLESNTTPVDALSYCVKYKPIFHKKSYCVYFWFVAFSGDVICDIHSQMKG